MAKQLVHYGKLLKSTMEAKGIKKEYVKNILGYTSYETLKARIDDAKFSYDELRILTENGLL